LVNAEQAIILSLSRNKIYAKVLNLLENHEIRALVDNRNETGRKLEMPKCKTPFIDCAGEEKRKWDYLYVVMDKKEKEISP
jgi:threonyl-tRNA synthetase